MGTFVTILYYNFVNPFSMCCCVFVNDLQKKNACLHNTCDSEIEYLLKEVMKTISWQDHSLTAICFAFSGFLLANCGKNPQPFIFTINRDDVICVDIDHPIQRLASLGLTSRIGLALTELFMTFSQLNCTIFYESTGMIKAFSLTRYPVVGQRKNSYYLFLALEIPGADRSHRLPVNRCGSISGS